jgi:hypothetical protein
MFTLFSLQVTTVYDVSHIQDLMDKVYKMYLFESHCEMFNFPFLLPSDFIPPVK